MQFDPSFLSVLNVLASSGAFMLGLLFLTAKSNNSKANIYLGLFLWSLGIEIFDALSESFSEDYIGIPTTSLFTIPLILLYVNRTINIKFKKWYPLLFLPGVIANFLLYSDDYFEYLFPLEYFFNIVVLLYMLKVLKHHKASVNNFYSDPENKALVWIKAIVFIYLGFHLLWIIEDIVGAFDIGVGEYFAVVSTILTFFMVYWIGHNGFSQNEIFKKGLFTTHTKDNEERSTKPDVQRDFSLKESEKFEMIKDRILNERLFANPKLNLRSLSDFLEIKEKELSKIINLHSENNFYHFINSFRIVEFKKLLQSPKRQQFSTLGLAQEAGFSSKSTFYSAFKTIEGMTPMEYKQSLKESE